MKGAAVNCRLATHSYRPRGSLLVPVLLLGLVLSAPAAAARYRQEGTPTTPRPADCRGNPRTLNEIATLAAAVPELTPISAAPPRDPADPLTAAAIADTVRLAIACVNANDPLRAFALFSDRYLAARFGPDHPDDLGSLQAAVSRQLRPAAAADRLRLVAIDEVQVLADGRIVALVITENSTGRYEDQLTFVRQGSIWLIDDWSSLVDPAAATPVG
jgi:hypothetical protein